MLAGSCTRTVALTAAVAVNDDDDDCDDDNYFTVQKHASGKQIMSKHISRISLIRL